MPCCPPDFGGHEEDALPFAFFNVHPPVDVSNCPVYPKRLESLAKVFEGVPVFREDEQLFVAEIGGLDQFPQLQELGLLLKFTDLIAE